MDRRHPTITGTDTQTHLLPLLQSILSFALIDLHPRTGHAALDAVGHLAAKACSHPSSFSDDAGGWVCRGCLRPVTPSECFGITSPERE